MSLPHQIKERPFLALATLIYCMAALAFLILALSGKEKILESASSLGAIGLWLIVMARSQK
jgi:hypothetical protein